MGSVPTGDLVAAAAHRGGAVAAFNVITLEHAEAIISGAEQAGQPVIVQISENAVRFHWGRLGPLAASVRAVVDGAAVDVGIHLDHVVSMELLRQAPQHGFSSVMFDASILSYPDNVAATKAAADYAHSHGLWLESELGLVGGKDAAGPVSAHAPGARTDPDQAASYVAATGVDALAVAIGSSHAMTSRDAALDHALLAALHDVVPVPLVLHGSSGVPDADLRAATLGGIAKVNVGTALNVAFTASVREVLAAGPTVVDPRRYLAPGREAMADVVAHFLGVLATSVDPVAG